MFFQVTLFIFFLLLFMENKENKELRASGKSDSDKKKYLKSKDYVEKRFKYQQNNMFNDKQYKNNLEQFHNRLPDSSSAQTPSQANDLFVPSHLIDFQDDDEDIQHQNEQQDENSNNFDHKLQYFLEDEESSNREDHINDNANQSNENITQNQKNNFKEIHQEDEKYFRGLFSRKKRIKNHDPNQFLEKICRTQQEKQQQQIKGLKIVSLGDSQSVKLEVTNQNLLICSELPPGITLKCKLRRSTSFLNKFAPQFDLYLSNGLKHILSAKKYPFSNSQAFKFSLSMGNYESSNCIASMRTNIPHNQYWLIGRQLEKGKEYLYASFLGGVKYQKLKKNLKQRQFNVYIPPTFSNVKIMIQAKSQVIQMTGLVKEVQLHLRNVQPQHYPSSEKNFILVDNLDQDYHYLKLQKQSDSLYNIQIQHPLCPLQAMAIALTRFDAQLK